MALKYELIQERNPNLSVIEQVLVNRGILIEDIPHYLHLTEQDNLSPQLLNNIDIAIYLIAKHIKAPNASIHIQVD